MKPSTAAKVATVAVAMSMLTSEAALAGKPGPPPLPNVRYRIKYVQLPDNTDDRVSGLAA